MLRQSSNQGKGAALQAGFQWVMRAGYDGAVTLDADGQHNPAEIPKFLEAYSRNQADLIIGQRDFSQMPPLRRLANWLGGQTYAWVVDQPIPDNQSGYRLISHRLIEELLTSDETGFEYEVEMITICIRLGFALE